MSVWESGSRMFEVTVGDDGRSDTMYMELVELSDQRAPTIFASCDRNGEHFEVRTRGEGSYPFEVVERFVLEARSVLSPRK